VGLTEQKLPEDLAGKEVIRAGVERGVLREKRCVASLPQRSGILRESTLEG
jgi:hypothetical protein